LIGVNRRLTLPPLPPASTQFRLGNIPPLPPASTLVVLGNVPSIEKETITREHAPLLKEKKKDLTGFQNLLGLIGYIQLFLSFYLKQWLNKGFV